MAKSAAYPDFSKVWSEFKAPTPDVSGWLSMQRRTMETLSAVNQVVVESTRALSRRQAEMVQVGIHDALATARDVWTSKSPEANASKHTELTKSLVENAVANLRELSDMTAKSNSETADLLSRRFVEGIEEFGKIAAQPQKKN